MNKKNKFCFVLLCTYSIFVVFVLLINFSHILTYVYVMLFPGALNIITYHLICYSITITVLYGLKYVVWSESGHEKRNIIL